jgi:citrate lyase beta subunit
MSHAVKQTLHPTLYSPSIMSPADLVEKILYNRALPVWRLVICTEDSIRKDQVKTGIANIGEFLPLVRPASRKAVFVRVRNADVLKRILELPEVDKLAGFVIPKTDPSNFSAYADLVLQFTDKKFKLMPILESHRMTDAHYRDALRLVLTEARYRPRIDCLRIGANDLMGHLGIRRDSYSMTVYDTPVGATIDSIINEFRGLSGFTITAPVFECFDTRFDDLLRKEVRRHILNGLFGQTVIHPRHLRIIRDMYRVSMDEFNSAKKILDPEAPAVNGVNGRMDESSVHRRWAKLVILRKENFGTTNAPELTLTPAVPKAA